jgi:integrase
VAKRKREKAYRNGDCTLGRRGNKWIVDIRVKGAKRQRPELEVGADETPQQALDRFAEARRAVQKQQASYTVGQLWTEWLRERAADKLSNDIYEANWVALGPKFASRTPDLLTAQDYRDYAQSRFDQGRSPWTVHTELVRLRACLKWAAETHLISRRPKVWTCAPGKHRSKVLSLCEARQLVAGATQGDPHIRLFVVVAFATGARHTAILDLTWDRIDFVRGLIAFDEDLPRDPMSKSWRKGRAIVPMNRAVRAALELAYEARQSNYVIEHGGRRLKSVREGFAMAVGRAGLGILVPAPSKKDPKRMRVETEITPHTIRHTVASWLEDRVGDARRAQLLGHGDIDTTRKVYTHSGAELLIEAVSYLDLDFAPLPRIAHSEVELQDGEGVKSAHSVPPGQVVSFDVILDAPE